MNITDLLYSNDATVAEFATEAVSLKDQLNKELISKSEYDELSADLVKLARIYENTTSLNNAIKAKQYADLIEHFLTVASCL